MICSICEKPLVGRQRIYCSKVCGAVYRNKHYGAAYSVKYASRLPKAFIGRLLTKDRYDRSELSLDYVMRIYEQQEGLCNLSKVPMTYNHGQGAVDTNISIDRIDPLIGYVEGNVQLVCRVVNHMKWSNSKERLLFWCKQIMENN